jgi:hypothetical protein
LTNRIISVHRGVLDLESEEEVNKKIGAQVPLIIHDKQQLKTINKQKRIISVFVSRVAADLDLLGTSHVVFTLRKDLG